MERSSGNSNYQSNKDSAGNSRKSGSGVAAGALGKVGRVGRVGKVGSNIDRAFLRYQQTGDAQALGEVFDGTAPELLRVAGHLTHDLYVAEDLVQATFLTAIQRCHTFIPEARVMPWLMGILTRLAAEQRRVDKRRSVHELPPLAGASEASDAADSGDVRDVRDLVDGGAHEPIRTLEAKELSEEVSQAIAKLAAPYRPVLILCLKYGMSAVEIAQALERGPSTVRMQMKRGLEMLRRILPHGLIAGAVVLTAPVHGLPAIREVVVGKALSAATASNSAVASATTWFGLSRWGVMVSDPLGRTGSLLTLAGVMVAAALAVVTWFGFADAGVAARGGEFGRDPLAALPSGSQKVEALPPVLPADETATPIAAAAASAASRSLPAVTPPKAAPAPADWGQAQNPPASSKGRDSGDKFGIAVGAAGDVNLDGYLDLVVGAERDDPLDPGGRDSKRGQVTVISGMDGALLFTMEGEQRGDSLYMVHGVGDVDQDGYADVAAGARYWSDPQDPIAGALQGKVYLVSGRTGGLLFTFTGESAGDYLGSVSGAGDVNLDGYDDVVAGALGWRDPRNAAVEPSRRAILLNGRTPIQGSGRVYVYSGRDGSCLLACNGANAGDLLGFSVSGAGDANLDGYPDVAAGALNWIPDGDPRTGYGHGGVSLFSGKDGSRLFNFGGQDAKSLLGFSLSGVKDVDLDGYPDLVAGAPYWSDARDSHGGTGHGRVYLISGKEGTPLFIHQGDSTKERLGWSVGSAGDVNLDGYFDLVAAAPAWSDPRDPEGGVHHGRVYLISGKDASVITTMQGDHAGDQMGSAVSGAGDLNVDGSVELVVGARGWDDPAGSPGAVDQGRIYLFSGARRSLFADAIKLSVSQASTQNLELSADAEHAGRLYWVFGNFAFHGSEPGVDLGSVHVPLNPDPWTQATIDFANAPALTNTRGILDQDGRASAALRTLVPLPDLPIGLTLEHCYLVYQEGLVDLYFMASNLVPWTTSP